jgi:hypothetical protein
MKSLAAGKKPPANTNSCWLVAMNVSLTASTRQRCTPLLPPIIVWECCTSHLGVTISHYSSSAYF